jgi:probable rRNA maturation factor
VDDDEPEPRLRLFITENSCLGSEFVELGLLERCGAHLLDLTEMEGNWSAGLHFCDETEMARLHGEFMNDPTPTDVMSFEGDEDDEGYLGDVIVCVDIAKKEAEHHEHSELAELQFYAVHGLLHLMGYDDETEEDRDEMHRLQRVVLKQEGVTVDS